MKFSIKFIKFETIRLIKFETIKLMKLKIKIMGLIMITILIDNMIIKIIEAIKAIKYRDY